MQSSVAGGFASRTRIYPGIQPRSLIGSWRYVSEIKSNVSEIRLYFTGIQSYIIKIQLTTGEIRLKVADITPDIDKIRVNMGGLRS